MKSDISDCTYNTLEIEYLGQSRVLLLGHKSPPLNLIFQNKKKLRIEIRGEVIVLHEQYTGFCLIFF